MKKFSLFVENRPHLSNNQKISLYNKSVNSNIPISVLEEVYRRGMIMWSEETSNNTQEQYAFDRVNSFIAGGLAYHLDSDLVEGINVRTMSLASIAKKHKVPLDTISSQYEKGIKVEKEHTKDAKKAGEIARDHLGEIPNYYSKLKKVEKTPVNAVKEAIVEMKYLNAPLSKNIEDIRSKTGNDFSSKVLHGASLAGQAYYNIKNKIIPPENPNMNPKSEPIKSPYGGRVIPSKDGGSTGTGIQRDIEMSIKNQGTAVNDLFSNSPTPWRERRHLESPSDMSYTPTPGSGIKTPTTPKEPKLKEPDEVVNAISVFNRLKSPVKESEIDKNAFKAGREATNKELSKYPFKSRYMLPPVDVPKKQQTTEQIEKHSTNKNKPSSRFIGSSELTKVYKKDTPGEVKEATFQGKQVPLNKPMKGDVKKSKVYVDPDGDGKAQKVNFGDKNLSIKKDQPSRKKSYCARSGGIKGKRDVTSANYWSRKAWDCSEETEVNESKQLQGYHDILTSHGYHQKDDPDRFSGTTYHHPKGNMVHIYTDPMRFSGYKAKIRKTGEEVSSPNTLNNKLKKIHGLKEELSLQDIAQRRKEATSTKTKDVFNRMRNKTPPGLINLDKRPTDNE